MSSAIDSRKQYDLRTSSRNSEGKEVCYVCGASQAYWSIFSKPTGDDVPFFPFLEYHKPPSNQERLDGSGRVLACNVCYSFLVQQWDSYEATKTPILKRLYWLKRVNTDLSRSQSPVTSIKSDLAADSLSDAGDREKAMSQLSDDMSDHSVRNGEQPDMGFDGISTSLASHSREMTTRSPGGDIRFQNLKTNQGQDTCVLLDACFLCGSNVPQDSLKIVHSRAQIKPDTPFYPALQQCLPRGNARPLDSQGKGMVCQSCHAGLFSQWQIFQANSTPVSDRRYRFSPSHASYENIRELKVDESEYMHNTDGNSFTCSLCRISQLTSHLSKISAMKRNANDPFFPFLKNLHVSMEDGWVEVCLKCKSGLESEWTSYEVACIATEDRLYRVQSELGRFFSPPQPENELICFVCGKVDIYKAMRSVFASPYANMDFDFLGKLQRKPGSIYREDRGEALVCTGCYHSLKSQWVHFEVHQVPRNSRRFQLHSIYHEERGAKERKALGSKFLESCEICEVECPSEATAWVDVFPFTSEKLYPKQKPFFPYLAKWKCASGQDRLKVCKLCFANLYAQWNEYEFANENGTTQDPWKRKYRVHHFTCFACGNSVHRTNIRVVPRHNYSSVERGPVKFAVQLEEFIAMCTSCKDSIDDDKEISRHRKSQDLALEKGEDASDPSPISSSKESFDTSPKQDSIRKEAHKSVDVCEDSGMKATATVPPLPTIMMGSQAQERGPVQNQGDDREGSFAAALRKLAQQALIPERGHSIMSDRQGAGKVSSSKNTGHGSLIGITDSRLTQSPGSVVGQLPYSSTQQSRGAGHPGPPLSVMAPVAPPVPMMDMDKPEHGLKGTLGRSPPSGTESPSRRQSRQILPGIFARPGGPDNFRAPRDDHRSHGGESSPRDIPDRHQPALPGSNFPMGAFSAHNTKDRSSSNVGLVHPQPVRKLPEEEHGSKLLNSVRCPSREPPSSVFRPPSPSEAFSRFGPFSAAVHSHGSQAPCPVHGHESGHRHGSPGEHGGRPHGLPFEGLAGSGLSDLRPYHAHRFREDFYPLHRHGMERKEPFPHHVIDEDLRRRGYDWPWPPVQPAFYDTEQYRRHLLTSFRSHEHPYKDVPHGQLYYSSLPYYGREFPLPVDPYLHPSLVGGADPYQHRHGPPLSPRLAEYYRRTELGLLDRPREPHESHRHGDGRPERIKEERQFDRERPRSSEESKPRAEIRKHDIRSVLNQDKETSKDVPPSVDKRPEQKSLLLSRTHNTETQDYRKLKPQSSPKKSLMFQGLGLLPQRPSESPRVSTDESVSSSRADTKPFSSRIDFSIAGPKFLSRPPVFEEELSKPDIEADMRELNDESIGSDDADSNGDSYVTEMDPEDKDKKMNYMNCLGLVPHGKRRALEEDYERRRWERKFRKIRGRPRKRTRRETTDESDSRDRPGSELDFYTGPMTRHKQQLLQEQENLLEQIQKSKEDMDDEPENRSDDLLGEFEASKGFSPSMDENSPRRSFLMATSCHLTSKAPQPLSIDTASIEAAMKNSSHSKGPNDTSRLLTLYRRGESEKNQHNDPRSNFSLSDRTSNIKQEEAQSFTSFLRDRTKTTTPRTPSQGSRWQGVEDVARSYTTYRQDQEVEEGLLRRAFERLKGDEDMLNHQTQQLKKDMMVLHEVKVKVGDEKQKLRWTMENLHQVMRTIASS